MISNLLVNNLLGCLRSKESRPKLGKGHSGSTVLHTVPICRDGQKWRSNQAEIAQ